jgi:hypothetical protein
MSEGFGACCEAQQHVQASPEQQHGLLIASAPGGIASNASMVASTMVWIVLVFIVFLTSEYFYFTLIIYPRGVYSVKGG